jgi:hypothetical protein
VKPSFFVGTSKPKKDYFFSSELYRSLMFSSVSPADLNGNSNSIDPGEGGEFVRSEQVREIFKQEFVDNFASWVGEEVTINI